VREGVVDSDPEAIAAFVRSDAQGAVRVDLEATLGCEPFADSPG